MTRAQRVDAATLLADLSSVLAAIGAGVVVSVEDGAGAFVLGPPDVCGQVMGLIDAEYGWPAPVQLADVRSVDDLRPSPRRHPFLFDGAACLAVSISAGEYAAIRRRQAEAGPAAP